MGRFVHIAYGDSAGGTLKYYMSKNKNEYTGDVISFREDHSVGPLYDIDTESGLQKRINWFVKMFKEDLKDECFIDIEREIKDTYKRIKNIGQDKKIVIWYGENTASQVGLRYLVALLENRELYEVNVSESYISDYNGNRFKPRALGECATEEIDHLILTMRKIEKERYNRLIKEWKILRVSEENLRVIKDQKIIGVNEDYYDQDIISNCTFNFNKAARIIGKTMGKSDQIVGDAYIDKRVRMLIESGEIEYRGKLETMRDFEIKVSGGLYEFFPKLFGKNCKVDEDGFYHYFFEWKGMDFVVDTIPISQWNEIDLSNKLVLDYDENNIFSLTWFKEGKDLISINHTLVGNIEYKIEEHDDQNNQEIKTETIILYFEDLIDKRLEIQIKPYICICLKNQPKLR